MGKTFVVPKKSGDQHKEPLKIKKCAFPGCDKQEPMTGKGCYCLVHRDRKYRKIIDADKIAIKKAEEEKQNPNQIIKHNYNNPVLLMMKCQVPGCGQEFEIKIFPNIFLYPKYCTDHRNEYKRQMFQKKYD